MRWVSLFCVALLIAACGGGDDGTVELDPTVLPGMNPYTFSWEPTADTEGDSVARDRGYLLNVPSEYLENPDEPWPLVLSLHGAPPPVDLDQLATFGLAQVVQSIPYRFIMAAPLATNADINRPEWAWLHSADYLKDFIDHVRSRVNIDPDRIYVTGVSWGATGAWALAAAYPDLPAALVTVAGGWNDRCFDCEWPDDFTDQFPANVCEMKDIPTWVFHGDADQNIPWEASQVMVDALEACGGDVQFTLQEGAGHFASLAWGDPALYEWMLAQGSDGDWPAVAPDWVAQEADCREETTPFQLAYEIPGPNAIDVTCDLVYKSAPSGADQTLDVYTPAGTGPGEALPTVIFFHFNGNNEAFWLSEREEPIVMDLKVNLDTHARVVASLGMVGITFNYSSYPMGGGVGTRSEENMGFAIQDAADLLAYVTDNAGELNVDPARICVWTQSTGSMVGAYTALAGEPQPVCAVVFTGPLDWSVAGQYNPADLVTAGMPPFFIARASADTATNDAIDRFSSVAREAGADQVTVERVQAVHNFEVSEPDAPATQATIRKALDFIMEHLGVTAP